jgi:Tol biopolymer transport system component
VAGLEVYRERRSSVFGWHPDGRIAPLSPSDGFFHQPCIHPGGLEVAYHGNTRGPLKVWVADLATGGTRALTDDGATAVHPSYSWDGERIALASDRAWNDEPIDVRELRPSRLAAARLNVYVVGRDGTAARQVTFGEGPDRRPCFSPDGERIAFLSNRRGAPDLWVTGVETGSTPRCLGVNGQGWAPGRPWFAADARHVFFYGRSRAEGRDRICRVPAEGGRVETLAQDDRGDSHGPFVDWDGRALIMHSTRGGAFNIWELPLGGGPVTPLFPPGFAEALHATRSRNGIVTFDVPGRGRLRVALRGTAGRGPAWRRPDGG